MDTLTSVIPGGFLEFVIIAVFSLIIGFSQKAIHGIDTEHAETSFGTDRTFTFIGILGYILWVSDASGWLFRAGLILLTGLLGLNYYVKITHNRDFGLTTILVALITYSLTALLKTQPFWLFMVVFVVVLVLTELKESLNTLSRKVEREEFITLGKFLAIAGIILPMTPDTPIVSFLDLTPYKIWLAVVVISSISYFSYLLRKFVFKDAGVLVTGILGGLYSSTATTIVLSRQGNKSVLGHGKVASAILLATSMMYFRVAILLAIFNSELFRKLILWMLLLMGVSLVMAWVVHISFDKKESSFEAEITSSRTNPLEFRIAIIFTLLFVGFSFITYFTLKEFGSRGLQALAYMVGVTDIDPFLINLFSGKYSIDMAMVATATMQALFSNNVLKLIYSIVLAGKVIRKPLFIGFVVIIVINLLVIFLI